jgi:hypothetical protein
MLQGIRRVHQGACTLLTSLVSALTCVPHDPCAFPADQFGDDELKILHQEHAALLTAATWMWCVLTVVLDPRRAAHERASPTKPLPERRQPSLLDWHAIA